MLRAIRAWVRVEPGRLRDEAIPASHERAALRLGSAPVMSNPSKRATLETVGRTALGVYVASMAVGVPVAAFLTSADFDLGPSLVISLFASLAAWGRIS